jgi:hypothetical protein
MFQHPPSQAAAENHNSHDVHAAHRHAAPAAEPVAPSTPCPHCPLESGAANVDHASCVAVDAQEDGGAAPPSVPSVPAPPVFLESWLLPAARASPPLIAPAVAHDMPLALAVPLNLRHCVLLI